jgi:hypothetical protein
LERARRSELQGTENYDMGYGEMPTDPKTVRKQGGTDTQQQTAWVASQQVINYEMDNTCAPTTSTSKGITAKRKSDSDEIPEPALSSDGEQVIHKTIESKQVGMARPKAETTSGTPADNKPVKASATKTQKGSPREDLTSAPRSSVRTQVRVELYKPTSRSVNKARERH